MANATLSLDDKLYPYFQTVAYDEPAPLAALRQATAPLGEDAVMQVAPEQGAFMAMLVRLTQARRILEIGTFTGYSTLAMALALPPEGRIIASDISAEWTGIGQPFWQQAGVAEKIDLRIAPGVDTISALIAAGEAGRFDMVFIDADKLPYDDYYEGGLKLLRQGGLMLIDNVLWGGDVARPEITNKSTLALRALNDKIRRDARVTFAMVPIADGVTMVRKS